MTVNEAAGLQVTVQGDIDQHTADDARTKIRALTRYAGHPIAHARVRISERRNPSMSRPFLAQATLSMRGQPVRAQVAATSAREALDVIYDLLRRQLIAHAEHWEARRGGFARPQEWRHDSDPAHRPDYYPRPEAEREIVRRKTFALPLSTVDDALFDMQMMDYQFHLFTEAGTCQDSVMYYADDGALRLAQQRPAPDQIISGTVAFEVSSHPAVQLAIDDAPRQLDLSGRPFLFFQDAGEDEGRCRGHLLYRRYDGHYGLITPAWEASSV